MIARQKAFEEVRGRALKQDGALVQTSDGGFMFAPMRNGEAIDPEAFSKLPKQERNNSTMVRLERSKFVS